VSAVHCATTHVALRARRAGAAAAAQRTSQRARLGWEDLADWPEWAVLDAPALQDLARRCAAWLHRGALARCIDGARLRRVRGLIGAAALERVLASPRDDVAEAAAAAAAARVELPPADALPAWLEAQGRAALLATVEGAPLREALREALWPDEPAGVVLPDAPQAQRALAVALETNA
jgi:hypothetical protein